MIFRMTSSVSRQADGKISAQTNAVMRASGALVGIAAESIAEVEGAVTLPQLRVLVMIATRGPLNLAAVATGLRVSASNASRICDRLLKAGLLDRRDLPSDRRNVTLTLTEDGQALVDRVQRHRRRAITRVLHSLSADERQRVADAFEAFAKAAGEPLGHEPITLI
jgi:DNA-binding MarR family transcriptional regulator